MKRISILLAFIVVMSFNIVASSIASIYSITLTQVENREKKRDLPVKGHRTPARPIPCTVSENGIELAIGADDIISYELWDADGEICLGVYYDDIDAANHIFSTPGEYQLVIEAGDYYYIGYINSL